MSELEKALDRLSDAVSQLVTAADDDREAGSRITEISGERDRLRAELEEMRGHREEDARLRAEAADAVRDALKDLRGLVAARASGDAKAGED